METRGEQKDSQKNMRGQVREVDAVGVDMGSTNRGGDRRKRGRRVDE